MINKRGVFFAGVLFIFLIFVLTVGRRAHSEEMVAVITELKLNGGDVQVRFGGKNNHVRPAVLQSLTPGTQILVSKDALVVVLFVDGSKSVTLDAAKSPFEIKVNQGQVEQGRATLSQVAGLLVGKKQRLTYVALATRGSKQIPTLLSPQNTKIMSERPNLQWMGMDRQAGTIRMYSADGLIWSVENLVLTQIKYPGDAASLNPGEKYSWSLERKGFAPEKAYFEIVSHEKLTSIQEKLASLQQTSFASPTTLAVLKSTLLVSNELYYEAREILMDAIKTDPDEPTLHFLVGEIYEKTGVKSLAAEEYGEAEFLMKGSYQ
jgi:hypothetical protein